MEIRKALEVVVKECPNPYAKTYADAALALGMVGEELRVQCLYVLSNITHWRGPKAKDVRATLKEASKCSPRL